MSHVDSLHPFTSRNPDLRDPEPRPDTVRLSELKQATDLSAATLRAYAGIRHPAIDTSSACADARKEGSRLPIPFPRPCPLSDRLCWRRDELIAFRQAMATVPDYCHTPASRRLLRVMQQGPWNRHIHQPAQMSRQKRDAMLRPTRDTQSRRTPS